MSLSTASSLEAAFDAAASRRQTSNLGPLFFACLLVQSTCEEKELAPIATTARLNFKNAPFKNLTVF